MRPSVSAGLPHELLRSVRRDLINESLYGRLASHFSVHHSSLAETGLPPHAHGVPLFGNWRPHWRAPLAAFLGCSVQELDRMRGADLRGIGEGAGVPLSRTLRFCRACSSEGYHCALFQHFALVRCERHRMTLEDRCPKCSRGFEPQFLEFTRS